MMIQRIGRRQTPAERSLQLAIEDTSLLELLSLNFFQHELKLSSAEAEKQWLDLPEEQREIWRDCVITDLREQIRFAEPALEIKDETYSGERIEKHLFVVA